MSTETPSLYRKLAEVMAAVGYVQKTGYNDFHKYNYVTEADLVEKVRGELSQRNVALIPSVTSVTERGVTNAKGKASTITTAYVSFTFCDGDSGETHTAEWAGAGDDPADKGLYKAYTGALKYFLMKAFLIPTGDDPEADNAADERSAGGQHTVEIPPAPRPLSDKNRAKVIAAVAESGISDAEWKGYRTALGAPTDAALTTEHAKAIRAWLDSREDEPASDIPSDAPVGPAVGDTSDLPFDESAAVDALAEGLDAQEIAA